MKEVEAFCEHNKDHDGKFDFDLSDEERFS